jgi:DNA helicase-2/ATP-dependent DNA helicase PcrA
VQELLNAIKEFTDNDENADKSIGAFLQQVSLLTNADEGEDGDNDRITLMTVHGAKGLEFHHVYVVGMEENLFPSQMMTGSREELEEERRLFYVALTRAQKKLFLTYATTRYYFGRLQGCEPSRFLEEVDPRFLKKEGSQFKSLNQHQNQNGFDTSFARNLKPVSSFKKIVSNYQPSPDFKPSNSADLAEGMRVEHMKFGFGLIKKMENFGNDRKAHIDFEGHGEKTLLLSFAKLKIVE